jgi:hypothetical protein
LWFSHSNSGKRIQQSGVRSQEKNDVFRILGS